MSANDGVGPRLHGTGAAYLRVSTDKQDTERQIQSVRSFADRHKVQIADRYWFEDHGWERDADEKRPEFNRLLALVRRGEIKWIVVDSLDRFGTKSAKRLFRYLDDLEEAGCRLFDVTGKELTGTDDVSELTAWVGGMTSAREQREKSKRVLGGMIERAKNGEWMGGPPKLGFDVGCFSRETDQELWRAVWEGREVVGTEKRRGKDRPDFRVLRRKVLPNGRSERLDGEVAFRVSKETQVMRIVPTRDRAKLEAAKGVFARYASESVSFFDLAKWLNNLGIRNSFGNRFQSCDVRKLLSDEAYLGHPTFRKRRTGRFHRFDAEGGVIDLEPELRGHDTASDPADVIRSSRRHFDPLIDRKTWDAVQKKLNARDVKKGHSPKNPGLYLAGLVVCAGCGKPMVARADRMEYYCGTWDKHRVSGDLANSPCLRNGVKQSELEEFIGRYLDETGTGLDLLTTDLDLDALVERKEAECHDLYCTFLKGLLVMGNYLRDRDPVGYGQMWSGEGVDVAWALDRYRNGFDPSLADDRLAELEAKHSRLVDQWADLPTPRAKDKAKQQLAELEAEIQALEQQRQNVADTVEAQWREVLDLKEAVRQAKQDMESEQSAHALRQRAEALRGLLLRIDCEFIVTGKRSSGPGNSASRLTAVTFVPIAGDAARMNGGEAVYGKPYKLYPPFIQLLQIRFPVIAA